MSLIVELAIFVYIAVVFFFLYFSFVVVLYIFDWLFSLEILLTPRDA